MNATRTLTRGLFAAGMLLGSAAALAEVTGIEIESRTPLAGGARFGDTGAYEQLDGTIRFAIDPANPRNSVIADLGLAPQNAQGLVEVTADLSILAPADRARGNGIALVDIPNRGRKLALQLNASDARNPFGDGLLMERGYTIVWVGWEFDIADSPDAMNIAVPRTTDSDGAPIGGLGFAAVRDLASWIKHGGDDAVAAERTLAFGVSQSGRFLRTFLYLGFNTDEAGRQAFDAVWPHIAGASRLDLNRRGAMPVSLGQFDATSFPFADAALRDPVSGLVDGTLGNERSRANQPLLLYTNSSVEYWGGARAAALVHSTPDGTADIDLQDNVRSYLLAGTQHGPAAFPPGDPVRTQLRVNPLNYWWSMRALLVALEEWMIDGTEPPASAYPNRAAGTLANGHELGFPAIPGVQSPEILPGGQRSGNGLESAGAGTPLPLLVAAVDADGNEAAGIRHPELAVPLATYSGWSFNAPEHGDPRAMVALTGSYVPFAATAADRRAAGDPRPSIAERYPSKADYLARVEGAAAKLVAGRYLLARDVDAILARAGEHWDLLTATAN